MKCYYHNERDAVGICRACSRGLCPDCISDLGLAIACRGKHEAQAKSLIATQSNASRAASVLPAFSIAMGIVFAMWGVLSQPFSLYLLLCGVGFAAVGVFISLRGKLQSGSAKKI